MKAVLVFFKPTGERLDIPLKRQLTVLGRQDDCAIRIPYSDVSRAHCQILMNNGSVALKDLGSSNGTYVNQKRVIETKLKAGDRIQIGPAVFTVQIDGKPANISQAEPAPPAAPKAAAKAPPAPAIDESDVGLAAVLEAAEPELSELEPLSDSHLSPGELDDLVTGGSSIPGLEEISPTSDLELIESSVDLDLPAEVGPTHPDAPTASRPAPTPPVTSPPPPRVEPPPPGTPRSTDDEPVSDIDLDDLGLEDGGDPFAGIDDLGLSDSDLGMPGEEDKSPA